MTVTLDPKTILGGTLDIISSKSDIHRCIICAAFADKETEIEFCGLSKDILTTVECVEKLGAKAEFNDKRVKIYPADVSAIRQGLVLDCHESGTTARADSGACVQKLYRYRKRKTSRKTVQRALQVA